MNFILVYFLTVMKVLKIVAALIGNTAYTITSAGPVALEIAARRLLKGSENAQVPMTCRTRTTRTNTGGKHVIAKSWSQWSVFTTHPNPSWSRIRSNAGIWRTFKSSANTGLRPNVGRFQY